MTKDGKTAECVVWSHQFGFELRLTIGAELVQSQVCRSQEQLIETHERWRAELEAKGWEGASPDRYGGHPKTSDASSS